MGGGMFAEMGRAVIAADGDEVDFAPDVILRRKAGDGAMEGHKGVFHNKIDIRRGIVVVAGL